MSVDALSFIAGGLFMAVAIIGGGIEIRELKIPSVGRLNRLLSFVAGFVLIGLAVFLHEPEAKSTLPVSTTDQQDWQTAAEYQSIFDTKTRDGFYPAELQGRCKGDVEQFRATWRGLPLGFGFESHHAVTKQYYDQRNQQLIAQGYSLAFANSFKDCSGRERYQATWLKKAS